MQNSHWIKTRDNNKTAVSSADKQLGVNNFSREKTERKTERNELRNSRVVLSTFAA